MELLPLVSVLVSVYNVEPYIEKCARSLFEQTYENLEFIVVDDCSPDNSIGVLKQVVQDYPKRIEQLNVIRHSTNRGLAAARNTSLLAARGDFLMFVDPDDWIERNAVELLMNKQLQTDADIVYGQVIVHYPDRMESAIEPLYPNKEAMVLHATQLTVDHTMWKRVIRHSLFSENKLLWKEGWNHGEDHYMLPQLLWFANKIERIEDIIYHYNRERINTGKCNFKRVFSDWNNELDIISFLGAFFADKSEKIVESLKETKVYYLIGCLGIAYSNRKKNKYNEIASMLYSMPETYLSRAWFSNKDERMICRFYFSRRLYGGVMRGLAKTYSLLRVRY